MTQHSHSLEEAADFLRTRDGYLISSHDPLDADAVGSEIALSLALEALGKKTFIANDGPAPSNLSFLPGIERVHNLGRTPVTARFPVLATVDCGGYRNLRGSLDLLEDEAEIINVDHHMGNEHYGKINYVDADASAAGILVYRLIRTLEVPLTEAMSWSLYAALTTDTGRFSYSNTRPETHEIAADLLRHGVRPDVVYQEIFRNKPLNLVQLEAAIAESIDLQAGGRVAIIRSTIALCDRFGIAQKDAHDLIDIPMQIRGVEVAILLREMEPDQTKISFRSAGEVDVNAIAAEFGGGGHRLASGCRIPRPLKEAEAAVLAAVTPTVEALS